MAKTSPQTDNSPAVSSETGAELRKREREWERGRERERKIEREGAGLTSVVEETQVGQHEPPLLPQLHSCAVLKYKRTESEQDLTEKKHSRKFQPCDLPFAAWLICEQQ